MVKIIKQDFNKNKSLFNSIREKLSNSLNKNIQIEHVGSTAIPNIYGKNIIDILIGAKDSDEFNFIKNVLEENGFFGSENSKTYEYQFFASRKEETGDGDIHIHLVLKDTKRYRDFIVLRDFLLENEYIAKEYSDYKKSLIENNIKDRKKYKEVKGEYVSKLIEKANNYKKNGEIYETTKTSISYTI